MVLPIKLTRMLFFVCLSLVEVFKRQATILLDQLDWLWSNDLTVHQKGINMQDYFMRFTLDSFVEIGFGIQMNSITTQTSEFALAFDYVQSRSFSRLDYGRFWKYLPTDHKFLKHL